MFYAKVLIGEPCLLKQTDEKTKALKMPPLNTEKNVPYDSVQGFTGNSDVYMIYSNKKAYPQYLITYK